MRKFPNLRTGKYVAQGAHASVGALLKISKLDQYGDNLIIPLYNPFIRAWLLGSFKKITLQVDTDDELTKIYNDALSAGIPASMIVDSGLTEFNGVPTMTAVGLGPDDAVAIDKITGHLKLF